MSLELFKTMRAHRARFEPTRELGLRLAGGEARLQLAGQGLEQRLLPPWQHLECASPSYPELNIEVWDSSIYGGALFEHPEGVQHGERGRYVSYRSHRGLSVFDRAERRLLACFEGVEDWSLYERGRPLHVPLALWHIDQRTPLVHAALVSRQGRGLLLAGASGAGKSSCALRCQQAGFQLLADDWTATDGRVGHSLYGSIYLERQQLARQFPELVPGAESSHYEEERDKVLLPSQGGCDKTQLAAVVLPRRSHTQSLVPVSRAAALLALAPSSLILPHLSPGRCGFESMAHLVQSLPCYTLNWKADEPGLVDLLEELVR